MVSHAEQGPGSIASQADAAASLGREQARQAVSPEALRRLVGGTVAKGPMLNVGSRAAGQHALATGIAAADVTEELLSATKALVSQCPAAPGTELRRVADQARTAVAKVEELSGQARLQKPVAPTVPHDVAIDNAANAVIIAAKMLSVRLADLFDVTKSKPEWLKALAKQLDADNITIACENIVKYRSDRHHCPECAGRVRDEETDNGAEGREYRKWMNRECMMCGWSTVLDEREFQRDDDQT